MKYAMYVVSAIIVIYWAIAFFALHAAPTVHIILIIAIGAFIFGNRYGTGHFLE